MSEEELYELLTTTGMEVAYDHFDEPNTIPPFILYRSPDAETFKADDKTYYKQNNYIVDLITELKEPAKEETLENIFNENNLPFDKEETYISEERIYQIRYFI